MRRIERHCETGISATRLAKVLVEERVISEKIGEEHDGQEVVIRIMPDGQGGVLIRVKWFKWDHGGCMIRESATW
jgi:hypothetical protein